MQTNTPIVSAVKYKKAIFFLVLFLAFAGYIYRTSVVRISKNFHEVDPGKFYRSAQLTPEEMQEVINKYGIKTVISLRGAPENSYWVPGQKEILAKNAVEFIPLGWTTDYFPDKDDLKNYIEALDKSKYPILVHCRQGADRTGEATAIYAIEKMGMSNEKAVEEFLSFKYWHVPIFHPAKSEFVKRYQGKEWALTKYDPCSKENIQWAETGHCPLERTASTD